MDPWKAIESQFPFGGVFPISYGRTQSWVSSITTPVLLFYCCILSSSASCALSFQSFVCH